MADVEAPPASFRIPLVQDSQWIHALPEYLGSELSAAVDPLRDRIVAQRIQRFESAVFSFAYATRSSEGTVVVAGRPPALMEGSIWGPLWRRLALAVVAGMAMFFVGGVVGGHYIQRAPWFETHGHAGSIVFLGLVAAVATGIAAAGQWLPEAARPRPLRSAAVWTVVLAWLSIGLLWRVGGPSLESAELAIQRGDLGAAQAEFMALEVTDGPSERLTTGRARLVTAEAEAERQRAIAADELHLADVRDAPSAEAGIGRLSLPWRTRDIEPRAREVALARARDALGVRFQAEDYEGLDSLARSVEAVDVVLAEKARTRSHLAKASVLSKRGDFADAFAALDGWTGEEETQRLRTELLPVIEARLRGAIEGSRVDQGELTAQRDATELALSRARLFESRTQSQASHTSQSLQARLEKTQKALEREQQKAAQIEAKRATAEVRARKKVEQAERRRVTAEARARANQDRRADRVTCCDGTLSPSCYYSQGSLRGCCSYHDGVC